MADDFCFAEDRFVLVGKVTKPHGLRGEVKVFPYSDDTETLLQYKKVVLVDSTGQLTPELKVIGARQQGKLVVFKLATVDDRNGAEALHGMGVLIRKADLPAIGEGEYYWHQLYSLDVLTKEGKKLGVVESIFSNGAQDIMVIRDGDKEYLIPIVEGIIEEQTEKGVIITPPPGLLEINTGEFG